MWPPPRSCNFCSNNFFSFFSLWPPPRSCNLFFFFFFTFFYIVASPWLLDFLLHNFFFFLQCSLPLVPAIFLVFTYFLFTTILLSRLHFWQHHDSSCSFICQYQTLINILADDSFINPTHIKCNLSSLSLPHKL